MTLKKPNKCLKSRTQFVGVGEPSSGRSVGRVDGSVVCWFPRIHPKAKERRQPPAAAAATAAYAARPPVDHIASIGDFGWDDGMATARRREKKKTAWHEEKRGPEAMMQRQG